MLCYSLFGGEISISISLLRYIYREWEGGVKPGQPSLKAASPPRGGCAARLVTSWDLWGKLKLWLCCWEPWTVLWLGTHETDYAGWSFGNNEILMEVWRLLLVTGGLLAVILFYFISFSIITRPSRRCFSNEDWGSTLCCIAACFLQAGRSLSLICTLKCPSCNVFASGLVGLNERMALNKAAFKFELGDWHPCEYLRASIVLG